MAKASDLMTEQSSVGRASLDQSGSGLDAFNDRHAQQRHLSELAKQEERVKETSARVGHVASQVPGAR